MKFPRTAERRVRGRRVGASSRHHVACLGVALALSMAVTGCRDLDPSPQPAGAQADAPAAVYQGEIGQAGLRYPHRVAAGPEGELAVSDPRKGKVFVFSPHRVLDQTITAGRPMGLAFDDAGKLYVGDTQSGKVTIYATDGTISHVLGAGEGEFLLPSDIAWSAETQRVHVSDSDQNTVKVYDAVGAYLYSYGTTGIGNGQFVFPTGIALDDASDRVYVGDHGNTRVQVFTRTGTWIGSFGEFGSGPGRFSRIQGMTLDTKGRLYVVDTYQGRLQVFDGSGTHLSFLGAFGLRPGQLSLPMDVALDRYGRLAITSYGSGKVLTYGIDGFTAPPAPTLLAASVWLDPSRIPTLGGAKWITAFIEVPGGSAHDIVADSLRLDGHPPDLSEGVKLGNDGDTGVPYLRVSWARNRILGAVPAIGEYSLELTGDLSTAQTIEGRATLTVFGPEEGP